MEEDARAPRSPSDRGLQAPSAGSFTSFDIDALRAHLNMTSAATESSPARPGAAGLLESFVPPKKVGVQSGDHHVESFVSPKKAMVGGRGGDRGPLLMAGMQSLRGDWRSEML